MKRLFDILSSAAGLVVLSPVLLWIAWRIKREDGGPIFYRGARTGLGGKPFRIFKFRTMVINADKIGPSSTSGEDPRITRIGARLRRFKLDELPQLLNVVKGEMSVVGPRPEVKQFTDIYTDEEKQILTVRPGITDWASIWNCDEAAVLAGSPDPDKAYLELIRPTKIKLQLKYVRSASLLTDLKIIFLTLQALLRPESQAVRELRSLGHGGESDSRDAATLSE
jgi:lipopolysaccharide/colanic/teichoic acid biosynthesis glycosyltransferase